MAESVLFKSYRDTERQKAERALDEALGRLDSGQPTEQPVASEQPVAPAEQQGQGAQPEERKPGVIESLKRGAGAIIPRAKHGVSEFKAGISGERAIPMGDPGGLDEPESAGRRFLAHPATRTVLGALDTVFPFAAFAGETGGDLTRYIAHVSGQMTDEALQERLRSAEAAAVAPVGEGAGELSGVNQLANDADVIRGLLAIPEADRLEAIRQTGSLSAEILSGFIPGYTAVAKGGAALLKGGAKAGKAAAAAPSAPKALPPAPAPRKDGAVVLPGQQGAGPRSLQQQVNDFFLKPEHRKTVTELVERALEERRASERTAAANLGTPGANRVDQNLAGRESLRQEFRTPLDANDSAVANEIVNRTLAKGGSTYSVHSGFHPGDSGYAVSIAPERSVKIRGELQDRDIVSFISKNEDLLADERAHLGTWRDENGVTHLDVSIVVDDLEEALALGREHKQLAVYDFANGKSIDVTEPERMLDLEHYSATEGLTRVDPEKFGTGQAGRERSRAGDPNFKKRSYFYTKGTTPEARFEKLPKYAAQIPESKILDLASDTGKALVAEAGNDATKLEALVQDRGFLGYRNSALNVEGSEAKYAQTQGNVVTVFSPLDVKPAAREPELVAPGSGARGVDLNDPGVRNALPPDPDAPPGSAAGRLDPDTTLRARAFDPQAYAQEKGLVYQGQWEGVDFHEFREDVLTKGGNFSVKGPLTREAVDTALGEHFERFGVKPQGEVGDPLVQRAAEARERLKAQFDKLAGDERGAINPVVLRGEVGPILSRQTANDLVTVGTEILWSGARSFRRWSQSMLDEFGDAVRPHLKDLYTKAQAKLAKVLAKSPEMKSVKQVLQYFHDGEFGAGWYDAAADELRRIFGENARLYANLLAATSPHNTVQGNVTFANKAMTMILTGERSAENLFTADDFGLEAHLQNLNRILSGQQIRGPKVGSFARAIMGDKSAVVVDTWMLRAFGFPADASEQIKASRERTLFIEKVIKGIASNTGLEPRQVQAAVWVGMKLSVEGKDTFVDPLHQVVRAKLVQEPLLAKLAEEARNTPALRAPASADDLGFAAFSRAIDELGEEGAVNLTVLLAMTRATIGAAAGAAVGDNPEQRAFYALLGAGFGTILSRRAATEIWTRLKDEGLLTTLQNEAGAINPKTPGQRLREERRAAREAAIAAGKANAEPMPNTRRMDATSEVKQAAVAINSRLSQMGRLLRDTTLTHDETINRALKSKYRDVTEILAHEKGTTFTRVEDGVAARDARDLVIEDLMMQAARAKESGDAGELAKVREQAKLAALISERVTDASTVRAQAQEAQKIPSRAARAKTVDYNALSKELQEFQSGLDDALVSDKDLIDSLLEMGERAKAAKLLEDAKKVPGAYWKIYYGLNLLSTPLFHPKNFIGNSGALALSIGARLVGEVVSYPFQLAGVRKIGSKELIAPGETFELVVGMVDSVKDAWTAGRNVMGGSESLFRTNKYGDRMDLLATQRAIQQPGGAFKVMVDGAARLADANLRFAGSTDEFYKVLAFVGEQRSLAWRRAWSSGKRSFKETLEEQARLLRETPKDIIEKANDFAEYNTFTKDFDREPSRLMAKLGASQSIMSTLNDVASHPFARLTITPFFRTPVRIAEFGTEFTPVLNLVAPKLWSDAMSGGANAQLAAGKIALATGMSYVFAQYAAAGLITGPWSSDPGLRARQKEAGYKPFSFYIPSADKYVSFMGLGPLVAPLAASAMYAQMGPNLKDESVLTHFMAMALATVETNLAMPYFDALNDVVQIFEGWDEQTKIEKALGYVADRLRTHVPAAGLLRSVAAWTDAEWKDLKEFGGQFDPAWRDVFNLFASTAANLPGFSRAVPAYRDILQGEPIPMEGGPLAGLISTPTDDPVRIEILELGGAGLPREVPRYIGGPKAPANTFRVYAPREGTVAPLTHEQRMRLTTLLTKEVKIEGLTLHQALTEMIVGPSDAHDEYVEQSDGKRGGKALLIHDLWNAYLDEAEGRLLEEDKDLQETIRRAEAARDRLKVPPAQLEDFDEMVEESVR